MDESLSERQWRFLKAAEVAAGIANRFRWREVGASLGFGDDESRQIADLLERRVAIVLPTEHEGQLLPLGRLLIHKPTETQPLRGGNDKAAPVSAPPKRRHNGAHRVATSHRGGKNGKRKAVERGAHGRRPEIKRRSAAAKGR